MPAIWKPWRPSWTNPRFRFVRADIADAEGRRPTSSRRNSRTSWSTSPLRATWTAPSTDPVHLPVRTNVMGTQVLMERLPQVRRAAASTRYPPTRCTATCPWTGRTCSSPRNTPHPYLQPLLAPRKAAADLLVLAYARTYGLPVSITRCSNNYGPYHFPEKLIPLMISRALADQPLPVYGKGENVRDWLYVEDHCAAIDLVMRQGPVRARSTTWAVTTRRANIDVVQAPFCMALEKPESPHHLCDRPSGPRPCATPSTPPRSTTSWAGCPRPPLTTASASTIRWYLAQPSLVGAHPGGRVSGLL